MLIRSLVLGTLATAIATQASALSCLQPSVQNSFTAANEAEEQYVMAVGRLTPLPGQSIPEQPEDPNQRQGYTLETRFDGNLASLTGFDQPAAFPVTLEVTCAGPWCGGLPLDDTLYFIERRDGTNVVVEGPCPHFALTATTEVVEGAMACLRGEDCTPPQ